MRTGLVIQDAQKHSTNKITGIPAVTLPWHSPKYPLVICYVAIENGPLIVDLLVVTKG